MLRNFKNNKLFSSINVLGLSMGLTVCILLSLYIWHECSYDNYHPDLGRLYQVGTVIIYKGKDIRFHGCPSMLADNFKAAFPQTEGTARICPLLLDDKTLIQNGADKSFYESKGFAADSGFFKLFHYDFIEGTKETAIKGPYDIVLSQEIAGKLFGGLPALGKTVHVSSSFDGEHDYTVKGVFRPMKAPSHIDARFFVSMYGGSLGELLKNNKSATSNFFFVTYVRINPADRAQIEKQLPAFVDTYEGKDLKEAGVGRRHFLLPVRDIHLHANMDYGDVTPGGSVTYLYILGSVAAFILLIACINFMNLATARSTKRSAEVGVRKVLGASRGDLIRKYLGESLFMALLACLIAGALTWLLLPGFNRLSGQSIVLNGYQVAVVGIATIGLGLMTGLVAGSYPAIYLSSFLPAKVLKGKIKNSLSVSAFRKGLVVFQFAISLVLIVAAMIIARQMRFLRESDLGFTKDHQMILPLRSGQARHLYTALKSEIQKDPHVLGVAGTDVYPGNAGWSSDYYLDGQPPLNNYFFLNNVVDFDFMRTMGMTPVAGHLFTDRIASDSVDGVVLNESGVKALGLTPEKAIGKRIHDTRGGAPMRVVGVVKDMHFEDMHQPIENASFVVNSAPDYSYLIVHLDRAESIPSIQKVWHALNPGEPFEYTFLDEAFMKHYEADNRLETLVDYATGIAVFISCLGLFGLAAFSAEQRTKEIGIRKVLGASTPRIVALLSGDFLKLVGLGILVGSPLGWFATHRWLQDFAYRTNVPWTLFALTTGVALVIALGTISFQSLRSALANPVDSLRTE